MLAPLAARIKLAANISRKSPLNVNTFVFMCCKHNALDAEARDGFIEHANITMSASHDHRKVYLS